MRLIVEVEATWSSREERQEHSLRSCTIVQRGIEHAFNRRFMKMIRIIVLDRGGVSA